MRRPMLTEERHSCGIPLSAELAHGCLPCYTSAFLSTVSFLLQRYVSRISQNNERRMAVMEVGRGRITSTSRFPQVAVPYLCVR
jgi:hypothetical protein